MRHEAKTLACFTSIEISLYNLHRSSEFSDRCKKGAAWQQQRKHLTLCVRRCVMRKAIYLSLGLMAGALVLGCDDDKKEPIDNPIVDDKSVCGDGICAADETADSCPADCAEPDAAVCGNGVCEEGESVANCSEDCEPDAPVARCGDGICDEGETEADCAIDCNAAYDDGVPCFAVYELDASIEIADTPGKQGDSTNTGLTGQLALRYRPGADNLEHPADGSRVEVLHYFLANEMDVQPVTGLHIKTNVHGFTPTCNGDTQIADKTALPEKCDFDSTRDTAAKATGVYDAESTEVTWQRCVAPGAYYDKRVRDSQKKFIYTPEDSADGPGCLSDYHSQGNVNCTGNLCAIGGLQQGDNIQDDTWNQPLEKFTLSADGKDVQLTKTRIPNREEGNTFVSFTGTRVSFACPL